METKDGEDETGQSSTVNMISDVLENAMRGSETECNDLLKYNESWRNHVNNRDPNFFRSLGEKQLPRYLYIGCCDSRVDPHIFMGVDLGNMFVHRNIGNLVSNFDLSLLSVVEYAVNVLEVPQILIVGHYECGAVRGSMSEPGEIDSGVIDNWVQGIRGVSLLHEKELDSLDGFDKKYRRLVELNVEEQCFHMLKLGAIKKKRLQTFSSIKYSLPLIHGMVFDPSTGLLRKLRMNVTEKDANEMTKFC